MSHETLDQKVPQGFHKKASQNESRFTCRSQTNRKHLGRLREVISVLCNIFYQANNYLLLSVIFLFD